MHNTSWLYNIATRERVQLPLSSSPVPFRRFFCNCQLGFDPATKLYKLLKLSTIYDSDGAAASVYFEILSIGVDARWRTIDYPLPSRFRYRGLCVDGVMYGLELINTQGCFLTAFHVAEERFLSLPLSPQLHSSQLLRFFPGGGPVLNSFGNNPFGTTLCIHRYRYGGDSSKERCIESEGKWDTETLTLPVNTILLLPRGILPNGKVLLIDDHSPPDRPECLFLYDPIEKQFKLAVINWRGDPAYTVAPDTEFFAYDFYAVDDFYYIEENIVYLKRLTSHCNTDFSNS